MTHSISANEVLLLKVSSELSGPRTFELEAGKGVFIGSAAQCGIQLSGSEVSPIHCRLSVEGGAIHLHDWMSGTGTLVNGQKIDPEAELSLEDAIQIGNHRIELSTSPRAASFDNVCTSPLDEQLRSRPKLATDGPGTAETSSQPPALSPLASVSPPAAVPPEPAVFPEAVRSPAAEQSPLTALSPVVEAQSETSALSAESAQESASVESALAERELTTTPGSSSVGSLHSVESSRSPSSADFWDELEFTSSSSSSEDPVDRETVDLLMAEIEDLRAALGDQRPGSRDRELPSSLASGNASQSSRTIENLEQRLEQLLGEAELSDQRIRMLEDLLLAADSAHRAQQEEKEYLESWLEDIEQKFSLREQEHLAELECLRNANDSTKQEIQALQRRLAKAAAGSDMSHQYEEALEQLQHSNAQLQEQVQEAQQRCRRLEQQLADSPVTESQELRVERADLARQRAELARQRHELVSQLALASGEGKEEVAVETEMSCRLRALREHLREIHEQEKQEKAERSLTSRISHLWHRVTQ
jgi:pSer/pThr/pTyr-binding forkhead associated (FHA) protein